MFHVPSVLTVCRFQRSEVEGSSPAVPLERRVPGPSRGAAGRRRSALLRGLRAQDSAAGAGLRPAAPVESIPSLPQEVLDEKRRRPRRSGSPVVLNFLLHVYFFLLLLLLRFTQTPEPAGPFAR